jgi:hypothetical protein
LNTAFPFFWQSDELTEGKKGRAKEEIVNVGSVFSSVYRRI